MFEDKCGQNGQNSCGAATLAIVAHLKGKLPILNDDEVAKLYALTQDKELSTDFKISKPEDMLSSPKNIMAAAEGVKLTPALYESQDIVVPVQVKDFKAKYIDSLRPKSINTAGLKALVTKTTFLQLLVYLEGDYTKTHWLLLQVSDTGVYYLYDTAYETNYKVDNVDALLKFNGAFHTGRDNNFYGIAISLS